MAVSEWLQVAALAVAVCTGLGMPMILWVLTRQNTRRTEIHNDIMSTIASLGDRLTHLDRCIDDLKNIVLGKTASRDDLSKVKNEISDTMGRWRGAAANEVAALGKRIFRLEDKAFSNPRKHVINDQQSTGPCD